MRRKRGFGWRWLKLALGALVLVFVAYETWIFARVCYWVDHNPTSTAFMDARRAQLKEGRAGLEHQWVPYSKVSNHLKRALIAAEDAKFLQHEGFDWDGIEHAFEKNLKRGKVVAGGSTISQQLAKNLFLSGERNVLRKAQEAIITLMLEGMMSKRRILEIYLNVIEWGEAVFGAEAAARHHFATSAAELTEHQAARLAAMVPRPRWYERHRNSKALARNTEIILARMSSAPIP